MSEFLTLAEAVRRNLHDGDTVVWHLSDETDTIIPVRTVFPAGVEPDLGVCTDYRPYYPNGPNEFTGPMPRAASTASSSAASSSWSE